MTLRLMRDWRWVAARGVLAIVFGVLTVVYPISSLVALVALFGAYAIIDGVLLIVSAVVNRQDRPHWALLVAGGLLGIGAGVLTFTWPAITALALLGVIAGWAILMGIVEIAFAIRLRREITGEWAMMLSGLLAIAFGVMLALNPGVGALAVVLWIGAYAMLSGALLLVFALRLRRVGHGQGRLATA